ncbi:hypothetical protein [Gloeobacter kilaueensis]|uniref:Uncharacterized protein n=1 Tax=Gloeobacter kilaueensis (strain ATCC BAA-2537 / CCAP 1431/1 / ULC 316 / JS1) TaxID=1183438 RepID=U5QQU4_GLOK1|nr:hypothetical protein [Gloeobacter kilaueensis]AGY60075.1 hypothetical protein GKIL_3829 [Gloeobacter kilaueensis JS1]
MDTADIEKLVAAMEVIERLSSHDPVAIQNVSIDEHRLTLSVMTSRDGLLAILFRERPET